ncbi:MAG: ATP synthase F1 subunit delta [Candidatus Buchananbacteria bacterium]
MRINTKKYAIALYQVAKESNATELKQALQNLIKILARKGLLSSADKIISDFKKYYNEKEGIVEITIETAFALSLAEKEDLIKEMKKNTGQQIELAEKINPELIGGMILHFNDTLIDGSLKTQLQNLRKKLATA